MIFDQDKINKVLGIGEYQPTNKFVCFLPFLGEFGWYIMTHVKRVQGYNHSNKIVCVKSGHECLFPKAKQFYHDWKDIEDNQKAGIYEIHDHETELKNKICDHFNTDDIHFISTSEVSWDEKLSLANNVFIPKSLHNIGLKTDIVITPRNRKIDPHRNWTAENWQHVINKLVDNNISIGLCGTKNTSFNLNNVLHKSYDYIDVDSDVELMNNTKLVISQESGLAYLSYLCKRPTFIIDHYHRDFGADLHRDESIAFKEVKHVWSNPDALVDEVMLFLNR